MIYKKSKTMGSASDLTVLAPWKKQAIDADEFILPSSRFALTFGAIYEIRKFSREAVEFAAFADPIERLEQIHSFRMIARPEGMLLSVSYDFGWESYMRALWRDARPFLDLLCCHCEGYKLAATVGVEEWSDWIRSRELVANYFYSAAPVTVGDLQCYGQSERLQLEAIDGAAGDLKLAGFASRTPDAVARENRVRAPEAALGQALRVLQTMHRLTRYFGADIASEKTPLAEDARTLLDATKGLLEGWDPATVPPAERLRFAGELKWYGQSRPALPAVPPVVLKPSLANVQRGVLTGFDTPHMSISHGAALFLTFSDAAVARGSIATLALASEAGEIPSDGIYRNVAFSYSGMTRLRLPAPIVEAMPAALREGAAARAGQCGDVRSFHPSRWKPLQRNWPPNRTDTADLGLVDVVIQLRTVSTEPPADHLHNKHPLYAEIAAIATLPGLTLLSVEMLGPARPSAPSIDLFGLRDGISQPVVAEVKAEAWSDSVRPEALLLGYPTDPFAPATDPLLVDGSFLAMRRMPMMPERFEALLDKAVAATGLDRALLTAKMVGRAANGDALVPGHGDNDFLYTDDPDGALCPRQSHVRRVNPRESSRRIMRRGMSFRRRAEGDSPAEQGSLFMAYCASLAEQYEVVLSWLNGANSTRLGSSMTDPLCGVPDRIRTRTYRFAHQGRVYRFVLPAASETFVGLSWSLYLFTPSLKLVASLADAATPAAGIFPPVDPGIMAQAKAIVAALEKSGTEAQWRACLDEPVAKLRELQRAVWEVVRARPAGILVSEHIVLVGSHDRIIEVMRDDGTRFSVKGAGRRIVPSIEKFHLGLDANTADYQREGLVCNAAIASIDEAHAFDAARRATSMTLAKLLTNRPQPVRIDVVKHLLEEATAEMGPAWFDLPDGTHIAKGASDWSDVASRTPVYPGDFWNSSRYAFNPFESAETARLSASHGQAILNAAEAYIAKYGRGALKGLVSKQLAAAKTESGALSFPGNRDLARAIVGSMLGGIATTLGNGARLLEAVVSTGEFQRLQLDWPGPGVADHRAAMKCFLPFVLYSMGLNPVPENKWREVNGDDVMLAGQRLKRDVKVVLGLGSASADRAATGELDQYIAFGMAPLGTPATPHGCPGRGMARGMLLGILAALTEETTVGYGGARFIIDISRRV